MKILSGRQPWWWAILHAGKRIENRKWNTAYRGPILLHASKGCGKRECLESLQSMLAAGVIAYEQWPGLENVPRGGIVGRARIVDVLQPSISVPRPFRYQIPGVDMRWHMPEQFGFVLADVEALPLIPWPGALGLRDAPPELLARIGGAS